MTASRVWVFFYGSYMNLGVLREVDFIPDKWEVAKLADFDIVIRPRANLVPADGRCVYGILATGTHAELGKLYAHAQDVLGETYLPEAVLAETRAGYWRPALCYISQSMTPRPAAKDYVDRILTPAREYGFPGWYIERIAGFAPRARRH